MLDCQSPTFRLSGTIHSTWAYWLLIVQNPRDKLRNQLGAQISKQVDSWIGCLKDHGSTITKTHSNLGVLQFAANLFIGFAQSVNFLFGCLSLCSEPESLFCVCTGHFCSLLCLSCCLLCSLKDIILHEIHVIIVIVEAADIIIFIAYFATYINDSRIQTNCVCTHLQHECHERGYVSAEAEECHIWPTERRCRYHRIWRIDSSRSKKQVSQYR